jgi:hypothetical protein
MRFSSLEYEFLGLLPCEVRVVSAEVAVCGGLLVDGSQQVEFLNDVAWAEVEVLLNSLDEVLISAATLDGAIRFDVDGEGVGETDGVGNLHENSVGKPSSNQGLSNIASVVGC